MRKHVVIVSEESVFAGYYKCGIGEVVDCMADALREYFDVTVITPGTRKGGKPGGRITLGLYGAAFDSTAAALVDELQPDLVHNFTRPSLIELLDVDCPKVLTFDRWEEDIADYLDSVAKYDHVTTLSNVYAEEMKAAHAEAAAWPLVGIVGAIADGAMYKPGGYFHKTENKAAARKLFYKMYLNKLGLEDSGKPLVVSMGRLKPVKGIQKLIDSAEKIAAAGVQLVVYGTGDSEYVDQLNALHEAGTLVYIPRMGDYCEMCIAVTGSDFYLMPSLHEVCGLQPMKAARMGTVPIITPVGGMKQNFDETTAILITDTIEEAVSRAAALSEEEYATLRENGMAGEWTWKTRILPWVELYGLETAPASESAFRVTSVSTGTLQEAADSNMITSPQKACPFAMKGE